MYNSIMARNTRNVPTEDEEQMNLVQYMKLRGLHYYHPPAEMYTTSWKQKQRNKAMGATRGFPDLVVVIPKKKIIFIEMKRTKYYSESDEQKEWNKWLNEAGGDAIFAHGAQEAIDYIESIIGKYQPKELKNEDIF